MLEPAERDAVREAGEQGAEGWSRWQRPVELCALAGLLVAALVLPGTVPTTDGPQHVLAAWLLNHLHDPGRHYDRYIDVGIAYSSAIFPALTALFERAVPIRVAAQATLVVTAATTVLGAWALQARLGDRTSPWRATVLLLPFGCAYYFGLYNYQIGVALGILTLLSLHRALGSPDRSSAILRWALTGSLLFATALGHGFAAAWTGLLAGLLVLTCARSWEAGARAIGSLFVVAVPTLLWMMMVGSFAREAAEGVAVAPGVGALLDPDPRRLLNLPLNVYTSPFRTHYVAFGALCLAALATASAVHRSHGARFAVAGLLALLLATVVVPDVIPGWSKLHVRFTPWLALLAVVAAPTPRRSWLPAAHAVVAALVALSSWGIVADQWRLAEGQRQLEAGIGATDEVPARRFYVTPDLDFPTRPDINMYVNGHCWYAIDEGGVFSSLFADRPEAHYLRQRPAWSELDEVPTPGRQGLTMEQRWYTDARRGLTYDEVLFFEPRRGQIDVFRAHGYQSTVERGRVVRMRPPHRTLELTVAQPDRPAVVVITYGQLPVPHLVLPVPPPNGSGQQRIAIPSLPAMPVDVRLVALVDGTPGPQLALGTADLTAADTALTLGP